VLPQRNYLFAEFGRELLIGDFGFATRGQGRRINGITISDAHRRMALIRFPARPHIEETIQGNRKNRHTQMDGEDRGASFEFLRRTIKAALAFRIEQENFAALQSIGARPHGGDQGGISIYRNNFHQPRNHPHDSGAENFRCT